MAYTNVISNDDAKVLQPEQEIVDSIVQGITQNSTILPLMRRLPDMVSGTATMNVLDTLPVTYFVDEGVSNGRKQTTRASWKGKKIKAEEIAVIVPIKKNVYNDSKYDIWGQIKPLIIQDAYRLIDQAIILGENKPTEWIDGLVPQAITAGNVVTETASDTTYSLISKAMTKVEEDGYDVNGIVGGVSLKGAFREGLLDTTGQPLSPTSEVMQLPRVYAKNGAWDNDLAKFMLGDFTQAVYAIREDMTFEVFDTGSITDADGKVIYNLLQDDMVALRFTFRLGWNVANATNLLNSDEATRFPFAVVKNA